MTLKTFKLGGVHPEENKLSASAPIELQPLPAKAYIPLSQHLGAPAMPIVKKGDKVVTGQLIAKAEGFISANIHSPFTGKVTRLDDYPDQSGYRKPAIWIDVDPIDQWEDGINTEPEIDPVILLSAEEIIDRLKEKGVVGLGGATFPTHVKLMVPQGKKADLLIINGVECEPYLTSDHRVMLEHAEEVLIGTRILMKGLKVSQAVVGIESNKSDAINLLRRLAARFTDIRVVPLKVKYPQGGEKQLIKAITGREVPSGKLPIEVGCVVQNVGTALAVYEAVQKNKPLIERIVTVTGKTLSRPCNLKVRIGTPISELVSKAGGLPEDSGKVLSGGPMMGKALSNLNAPVIKGTSGIVVLRESESKRIPVSNCIRCGKCIAVCPMGLEPVLLAQLSQAERWDDAAPEHIMDCIECGSCLYICPAGRPLLDFIRVGKQRVGWIIRTQRN